MRSTSSAVGPYPGGQATTNVMPVMAGAMASERATLLKSPTHASRVLERAELAAAA